MENLEEKFIELIEKFEKLSTELAPEVLELGLMTARVAAGEAAIKWSLVVGLTIWSVQVVKRNSSSMEWCEIFPENKAAVKVLVASIIAMLLGAGSFISVSIWPFVGIFYPELWIAKRVLGW